MTITSSELLPPTTHLFPAAFRGFPINYTIPTIHSNLRKGNLMAILQANDSNFDELVLQSDKPVLVDFFATWCGPCKMLSPILEDMSKSSDYTIVKVDIDENPYLVREWEVASVPTLFIVKNGEKKEKMIGFQPKKKFWKRNCPDVKSALGSRANLPRRS